MKADFGFSGPLKAVFFLIIFAAVLSAANGLTKAGIAFARGNLDEAERTITAYIKKNPDDKKARALYKRIVVKRNIALAEKALSSGDEDAARVYAGKAYKADPQNAKARNLYMASKKIKKVTVGKQKLKGKTPELKKPEFGKFPEEKTREKVVTKTKYKTRTEYKTKEIVQQVAEIPDWIWLSIVFNLLLLAGLYFFYSYKKRSNRPVYENYLRAKLMLSNALKYDAETVKSQLGADRAAELFRLLSVEGMPEDVSIKFVEPGRAFTDINPVPRLTADVIELAEQFLPDKKEVVEFIKPYLHHRNNRVQGNAVEVMFRHKPSLALKTLKEMSVSEDRWKKVSAVWVCSRVDTADTRDILKNLASDGDIGVSMAASKALRELEEKDKENLEKVEK